jgi:site-specific DNA-methyltransferase (adenine-specific)
MDSIKTKISDIKLNPNNPRLIKDDKFAKLVKSIKEFPEMLNIRPIVVNKDMIILGGNMRFKACKEAGLKEIPVIIADNLTEEQEREFLIKDNTSGGEWDFEMLANEWDAEQLEEWGLDIPDFEADEVLEAVEDDFDATPPEEPKTVLGDLYEIGEHRLLCGDSTCSDTVAKLMNGSKADMVFTDPPYGVDYKGQISSMNYNGSKGKPRDIILNDKDTKSIIDFMPLLKNFCNGAAYIFCGAGKELDLLQSIKDNKYEFINTLIWNKPKGTLALNANYKPCFELFYYIKIQGNRNWSGNNAEWTVWDIEYKKDNTLHPTQKPIGLIEKAIKNHTAKSILDFFLGSGSTMVASHQLKRKCYGMELDPKYCDVIVKRMIKLDDTLTIKLNGVDVTKDWK